MEHPRALLHGIDHTVIDGRLAEAFPGQQAMDHTGSISSNPHQSHPPLSLIAQHATKGRCDHFRQASNQANSDSEMLGELSSSAHHPHC